MNSTFRVFPALFLGVLFLLTGCTQTSPVAEEDVVADSSRVYTQAVHVLVDGDDVGQTPRTVQVRRGFGTRKISLWQAGEEFRTYEIEISNTVAGDQMLQGFWSTDSMEGDTYDVQSLPNNGEGTFYIPYTEYPIKVEDRTYGLTLLVRD